MKTFRCTQCSQTVFFENNHCGNCQSALGFVPQVMTMVAFKKGDSDTPSPTPPSGVSTACTSAGAIATGLAPEATAAGKKMGPAAAVKKTAAAGSKLAAAVNATPLQAVASVPPAVSIWVAQGQAASKLPTLNWKPCQNYTIEGVCNWMLPADEPQSLCASCRYTQVIPSLSKPENKAYLYYLESAKRRLIYSLRALSLPIVSRAEDPEHGLAFQFLEDANPTEKVLTGHQNGLITLNVLEADDAAREARRTALHEPYRTLLGHFRHEIGHFYWDQLVDDSDQLEPFRKLFGDERQDYEQALKRHYEMGPPAQWQNNFISAYAAVHPWEDWAETWAHYMHTVDALETAQHWRMALAPVSAGQAPAALPNIEVNQVPFNRVLVEQWLPLSQFLNSMARSLGQGDFYPFVLSPPVIEKLCFVYQLVEKAGRAE